MTNGNNFPIRFPKIRTPQQLQQPNNVNQCENEENTISTDDRTMSARDNIRQRNPTRHFYDNLPIFHFIRSHTKSASAVQEHHQQRTVILSKDRRNNFSGSVALEVGDNRTSMNLWNASSLENLSLITSKLHRRGFFSRKERNLMEVFSWSADYLGCPLLNSPDKLLKREAGDIFKFITVFMSDRKIKSLTSECALQQLIDLGWSKPQLRDEIYLQLVKQTSNNPSVYSLLKGWELIGICLSFFPPTTRVRSFFESHIRRLLALQQSNALHSDLEYRAKVCLKRLLKICLDGPRKGVRKPTNLEIDASKRTIFDISMFGSTLDELMDAQRQMPKFHDVTLPWIQVALSNAIIFLDGTKTEGIFRIPGDVDEVNNLKAKCDQWSIPLDDMCDPHVPASLLKLWYRELAEPLIPNNLYHQCINHCQDRARCLQLVNLLPKINRNVLIYLVKFLQLFAHPRNSVITKMDVNNLALVMAPNCFRSCSRNPIEIVENSRKEMQFLRTLVTHWSSDEALYVAETAVRLNRVSGLLQDEAAVVERRRSALVSCGVQASRRQGGVGISSPSSFADTTDDDNASFRSSTSSAPAMTAS